MVSKWDALSREQQQVIGGFFIGMAIGGTISTVLNQIPPEYLNESVRISYLVIASGSLLWSMMIGIYNVFRKEPMFSELLDSFFFGFVTAFGIIYVIETVAKGEWPLP